MNLKNKHKILAEYAAWSKSASVATMLLICFLKLNCQQFQRGA